MTTQEAIKQLQTEHDLIAGEHDLDGSQFAPALLEALAMAIEALKAQDMTLYMNLPEVSAEEAVEILKRNNRIELIPSGEDTNVPNTDTISRQATITEIKNYERDSTAPIDYVKIVEQMPSAQPERPKGHWIHVGDGYTDYFRCSECGNLSDYEENFCCECGSDNRGEQDAEIR